jgi:hypothetical protein
MVLPAWKTAIHRELHKAHKQQRRRYKEYNAHAVSSYEHRERFRRALQRPSRYHEVRRKPPEEFMEKCTRVFESYVKKYDRSMKRIPSAIYRHFIETLAIHDVRRMVLAVCYGTVLRTMDTMYPDAPYEAALRALYDYLVHATTLDERFLRALPV